MLNTERYEKLHGLSHLGLLLTLNLRLPAAVSAAGSILRFLGRGFMNSRTFAITLCTVLAMTVQVPAHAGGIHFTPLNDPNQSLLGTAGNAINDLGVVAGNYWSTDGLFLGFVSTPPYSNKSFTTIGVAGAPFNNIWGINLEGAVAGWALDNSGVFHGFVSHPPYTTVTTLDAPGACSSDSNAACNGNGTVAFSINLEGVVAGYYADANGTNHGFVSHPPYTQSTFTTFDPPGATETIVSEFSLSDLGAVTGYYRDANIVWHGFVSYPPYTRFRTFDAPGACSSGPACATNGTFPQGINLFGVITGTYWDPQGQGHGFVSFAPYTKTTFTSFDPPGSVETVPSSINAEGVVAGYFYDASIVGHGFVSYPPYTRFTTFDAPGACSSDSNAACNGNGTFPYGINVEGVFTGFASDTSGNRHGFVARP
jgi:hypothetical protein